MRKPEHEERDLAHEADMEALMRQQLRDNISPEEAAEECAEIEARDEWMDGADLLGDPDEYDEEDGWDDESAIPAPSSSTNSGGGE